MGGELSSLRIRVAKNVCMAIKPVDTQVSAFKNHIQWVEAKKKLQTDIDNSRLNAVYRI